MDKIYIGTITSCHGIKGELKLKTDFEYKDKVLVEGFKIYINGEEHTITSYRPHNEISLITIDDLYDINLVNEYRGTKVFINKEDLHLKDDEILIEDLENCEVLDEDEKVVGTVKSVLTNNAQIILDLGNIMIPYVSYYIFKVDKINKKIYTTNLKELMP